MNSAYSTYGGHLTITIPYIMTQWSILSQTETYESESVFNRHTSHRKLTSLRIPTVTVVCTR